VDAIAPLAVLSELHECTLVMRDRLWLVRKQFDLPD